MSQSTQLSQNTSPGRKIDVYLHFLEHNQPRQVENTKRQNEELKTTPLFTPQVDEVASQAQSSTTGFFKQYALLGQSLEVSSGSDSAFDPMSVPVILNTDAPWSAFICGTQGSGKSHTLSCMLEDCLMEDDNKIITTQRPLSAMLFNYDIHASGRPCEAVFLASHVKTRVLVSPSDFWAMQ